MQPIPGKFYEVPCAEIRLKEDGRVYLIPVLDHLHADPQFGFPDQHYHIDGRFMLHPRMRHYFKVKDGKTAQVILPEGAQGYELLGIKAGCLKCEREVTGLELPGEAKKTEMEQYERWYRGYIGRECKGRRCPHLGTEMMEEDRRLVCPMHGLEADLTTLKIVARTV